MRLFPRGPRPPIGRLRGAGVRGAGVRGAVVAAVVAVTACSAPNGMQNPPTGPTSTNLAPSETAVSTTSSSTPRPLTSPSISRLPTTGSTASSAEQALRGTVTEGVESRCIVLTDDSGTVLANLIGLDTTAAPIGSRVEVIGVFQPGLMTTCQQGIPFDVRSVTIL